jgi:hypothetical protein
MDLHIQLQSESEKKSLKIDNLTFQKMVFLHNALNDGWSIKKRKESYIFTKNHEGKKEVFLDSYLVSFMKNNLDLNKLLV